METIQSFNVLERELRTETNKSLRAAAKECSTRLAVLLARAAHASGVPVARRVASSIRVKSDRIPVVQLGGSRKVGRGGAAAGALVWGYEQGPKSDPNRWGVPPSSGYWIAPTVAGFQRDGAVEVYKRAVYELQREVGLV
jgi:hypothetical protein